MFKLSCIAGLTCLLMYIRTVRMNHRYLCGTEMVFCCAGPVGDMSSICVQALRYADTAVSVSESDDIHLLTTLANIHRELKSYAEAEKVSLKHRTSPPLSHSLPVANAVVEWNFSQCLMLSSPSLPFLPLHMLAFLPPSLPSSLLFPFLYVGVHARCRATAT